MPEPSNAAGAAGTAASAPRSLAEALRARDDVALAALLHARPDLLNPVPGDVTQLATRAGTRASVLRALDRLDRFALQTAEALAVAPDPCPYPVLEALLTGDTGTACAEDNGARAALPRALGTLRDQALVWGDHERLRLVRTARELLAPAAGRPSPTGLGPTVAEATAGMSPTRVQEIVAAAGLPATHDPVSAVTALTGLFTDPERMSALLDEAPAEAHQVLGRLVWGPPYGEVTPNPTPPVRWLRDRGLLLPSSARTVVLPREVALYLRGGLAHRVTEPVAPAVPAHREHRPQLVDANAAGQALAALSTVEELVKSWEHAGPAVLRAGGLSVRDLKRAASTLDATETSAAFWIELAYAAGLLASDGEADERYAPTPAFDDWCELPPAERWSTLARAWLPATRTSALVGEQDGKGRTLAALGPDLDRSAAPEVRRRVLDLLAELPEGGSADPDTLFARLAWERPVRGTSDLRARLAHWTLTEAEVLGVTGRGALAAFGRALLEHRDPAPLLAPLLPEPVDHVLLQADLTAVAPGPLRRGIGDVLATLADVESKGGATVYRFTPGSVRRALDSGHTAVDLHAFLAEHSRTPVPQPLAYLIDDVARRHGHLRVGAASSYVRCDDDAMLGEILADKRSAGLGLRRLAPTVLAAQADPTVLLDGLRAMGYAPAAESRTGDVLVARADAHRTPARSAPTPVPDGPPVPDATLLGAAVRAIRAGDLAATAVRKEPAPSAGLAGAPGELPRTSAAETLATVQAAALTGSAVWIGYVNAEGAASQRVLAPVRVEGGFVTGYDHTADEVRTYALHRITGVAELAEDQV
ncbi:helicase C-terminal domain-containing protein [Streptomyces sp. NPDC054949]|uniref:helicase C-terminal domain-containing protein n=1 Tax=unclassified Streptomyces TaxID=2593676 RepID=UPI00225318F2|nr:helicase C-terminal domain-containing protein [Streptomyces sp. NBC_00424]MCX5074121.1 helicase C-terminal domain-containing protein [Streptomyces sp. NBC_00424]WUD42674.1 helicase C-terminal domain-containing protein [Streptomyces sp. NBC_00513]